MSRCNDLSDMIRRDSYEIKREIHQEKEKRELQIKDILKSIREINRVEK